MLLVEQTDETEPNNPEASPPAGRGRLPSSEVEQARRLGPDVTAGPGFRGLESGGRPARRRRQRRPQVTSEHARRPRTPAAPPRRSTVAMFNPGASAFETVLIFSVTTRHHLFVLRTIAIPPSFRPAATGRPTGLPRRQRRVRNIPVAQRGKVSADEKVGEKL